MGRYTKLIAYIFLLLAFFYLFGYDNILRYLRGGTTVVKYDEKIDAIPPPGIKMCRLTQKKHCFHLSDFYQKYKYHFI